MLCLLMVQGNATTIGDIKTCPKGYKKHMTLQKIISELDLNQLIR